MDTIFQIIVFVGALLVALGAINLCGRLIGSLVWPWLRESTGHPPRRYFDDKQKERLLSLQNQGVSEVDAEQRVIKWTRFDYGSAVAAERMVAGISKEEANELLLRQIDDDTNPLMRDGLIQAWLSLSNAPEAKILREWLTDPETRETARHAILQVMREQFSR